jgi:hypothetical protein
LEPVDRRVTRGADARLALVSQAEPLDPTATVAQVLVPGPGRPPMGNGSATSERSLQGLLGGFDDACWGGAWANCPAVSDAGSS